MDTVGKFAGEDPDTAVVEPEARATSTDFYEFVTHYEIINEARGALGWMGISLYLPQTFTACAVSGATPH